MANPQAIHALLFDSNGSVLLVRRRGAVLLGLPGGDVRGGVVSLETLLATLCSRQVGVAPDFVGEIVEVTLAERNLAIGFSEIPHSRAGARGRVEAAFWIHPAKLPMEVDPIARYAIALFGQRNTSAISSLTPAFQVPAFV